MVVNADGVSVPTPDGPGAKPVPMPAQTVMFLTGTWPQSERVKKNIYYLAPEDINQIDCSGSCLIIPLENAAKLGSSLKTAVSGLNISTRPGFALFYKGIDIR